jgi:DNA primase
MRRAFGLAIPRPETSSIDRDKIRDARRRYAAAQALAGTRGVEYLIARKICEQVAERAGVRFAADFYGRPAVLFPVRDHAGDCVAVNGRYIDGRSDPKTRVAGRKKLSVFATCAAFNAERLVICEAPIDALSLAICGAPSIALGGTDGPGWLPATCAFRTVTLAFDADEAGDVASTRRARDCQPFGARVERWRPSEAKDWNELLKALAPRRLRAALNLEPDVEYPWGFEVEQGKSSVEIDVRMHQPIEHEITNEHERGRSGPDDSDPCS